MMELEVAYQHCRAVTKRDAKNFYYAFITLPQRKRKAIYAPLRVLPHLRRRRR